MGTEIKAGLAAEAVGIVNGARRAAYGTPERNFGRIARLWEAYLQLKSENRLLSSGKFTETEASVIVAAIRVEPLDIAAMMRLMKEARLIESPDHRDSYVDLVGYTLCGGELALPMPETIDGTAEEVTVEAAPMVDPSKPSVVDFICEEFGAAPKPRPLDAFPVGQRVKLPNAPGLGTVSARFHTPGTVPVKWDDGGYGEFVPEDLVSLEGTTPARPGAETFHGFTVGDRVNLDGFEPNNNPGKILAFDFREAPNKARIRWDNGSESVVRISRLVKLPAAEAAAL